MKSLSSVGFGLSIVFGVLFLALIVELYYLLWWKKRFTTPTTASSRDAENHYNNNNNPANELFYMFCWKKSALNPQEISFQDEQQQQQQAQVHHLQSNKDLFFKPFDVDDHDVDYDDADTDTDTDTDDDDDNVLGGPPRVLFTIVEETKEDLESEEGKSKRGRSLSDVLLNIETPYLTPLGSPPFFTPPLTPLEAACCYSQHGFNPLFESSSNGEDLFINKLRPSSSPPPKFKFLQEAEEKLHRKITLMEGVGNNINGGFDDGNGEEDGSFFTIIVDQNREKQGLNHNH